jgi:hypothetical protein
MLQDVAGRYRTLQDVSGRHRTLQDVTGRHRTLQDVTGRYRTLQDVTGRYRTLQDVTGRYRTLHDVTGRYRTLQDVAGRYRTLQDVTERYRTLQNVKRRYRTLPAPHCAKSCNHSLQARFRTHFGSSFWLSEVVTCSATITAFRGALARWRCMSALYAAERCWPPRPVRLHKFVRCLVRHKFCPCRWAVVARKGAMQPSREAPLRQPQD